MSLCVGLVAGLVKEGTNDFQQLAKNVGRRAQRPERKEKISVSAIDSVFASPSFRRAIRGRSGASTPPLVLQWPHFSYFLRAQSDFGCSRSHCVPP
jgi:hypothetical protein